MSRLLGRMLSSAVLCMYLTACFKDPTQHHRNRSEPKRIELKPEFVAKYVRVDVSSFTVPKLTVPAEKESPRFITNLAPQAQQELIKTIANRVTPAALLKILGDPLPSTGTSPAPSSTTRIIPKQITKRFIMAVGKPIDGLGLADRIAEIQYSVYIDDDQTFFNAWDSFESKYGTIDLGKITSSWGTELKAAIDAKIGATDAGLNIGPSVGTTYNNKYEVARELKNRFLVFSGVLHSKEIIINQRGEQGNDIDGNSSVVVECETKADWAKPITVTKLKKLYRGNEQHPVPPDSLKLESILVLFPDVRHDVLGKLKYNYSYRQIIANSKDGSEANQRIAIVHGELDYPKNRFIPGDTASDETRTVVLLQKKDFRPVTYQLVADNSKLTLASDTLNFDTTDEAANFLRYLRTYFGGRSTINRSLKLGATPIDRPKLLLLSVKTKEN